MGKITRMGSDQAQYAESILIPSDISLVYVSGILADIGDSSAPVGTIKAYGYTQTQTVFILNKIKNIFKNKILK